MATVVCIKLPPLPSKYKVTMPGIGELTYIRDSLENFPRPSTMLLKFLNGLSPALAPIYSLLKLLDVIQAIIGCVTALPKALLPPNPKPIIKCLQKLAAALAALVPLIPPLAYIRLVVDIVVLLRDLVADLFNVLSIIDKEMSKIRAALAKGQEENDLELVFAAQCARDNLNTSMASLLEIIELIGKFMGLIFSVLDLVAAVCPPLQDKVDEWKTQMGAATESIGSVADPLGFLPIAPIKTALENVLVVLDYIARVGNSILGLDFNPESYTPPTFTNP